MKRKMEYSIDAFDDLKNKINQNNNKKIIEISK